MTSLLATLLLSVSSLLLHCGQRLHVEAGSGYLIDPPSRSSMWRLPEFNGPDTPVNYDDMSLDCGSGGAQWTQYNEVNQGRCGECGDEWSLPRPRPNDEEGEYGRGIIGKVYRAQDVVNMTVVLLTGMLGYFEFRLCAYKKSSKQLVTEECFDRHLLAMVNGSTRYYIGDHQDNTNHTVSLKLPEGNVNCQHCVIQWRYYTGNSWGTCSDGSSALGCGNQAEFRNCADVTILPLETSGYLVDPASRSTIIVGGGTAPDMSLDCGGQWAQYNEVNGGRCGECGDEWSLPRPRPNEEGGEYGRGIIAERYTSGYIVNMTVYLERDYSGYFEFRLCADKSEAGQLVTQECFDQHLLTLADGSTRYRIPAENMRNSYNVVSIQLPIKNEIDCRNCVIQWRYRTGHQSWGTCEDGTFAIGCGAEEFQQELRNCADVVIEPPPLTETAKGFLFFYSRILKI